CPGMANARSGVVHTGSARSFPQSAHGTSIVGRLLIRRSDLNEVSRFARSGLLLQKAGGRFALKGQRGWIMRHGPCWVRHRGDLPPAVDPAQLDLSPDYEVEKPDQGPILVRQRPIFSAVSGSSTVSFHSFRLLPQASI